MKYPLLAKMLGDAMQSHQDKDATALKYASHHRYHCGGSEQGELVSHIPPAIADVLEDVLAGRGEHCPCCDWSGTDVPIRRDPLVTLD